MNEINELEAQLRSWKPRRPSAKVSHALFGRDVATQSSRRSSSAAQDSTLTFSLHWLAPAMAMVAVMWTIFHQSAPANLPGRASAGPAIAVILSNQSLGSFLLEASNREPASPANYHRFDLNGTSPVPNGSGVVATSSVSTGASERLPDWGPKLQMPKPNSSEYLLTNNGAELPPSSGALPLRSGNEEHSVLSVQYAVSPAASVPGNEAVSHPPAPVRFVAGPSLYQITSADSGQVITELDEATGLKLIAAVFPASEKAALPVQRDRPTSVCMISITDGQEASLASKPALLSSTCSSPPASARLHC